MDFQLVNVGIADLKVASSPDILRTILGSCVGICLYDREKRVGGLSHIMLPLLRSDDSPVKKYASSAIPLLVDELRKLGGVTGRMTAKIVGGANMFAVSKSNLIMGDIGKKNIDAVRMYLDDLRIGITAEDVGGDYGRTVDFYTETGMVRIKAHGRDLKII